MGGTDNVATEQDCSDALREAARELGKSPTNTSTGSRVEPPPEDVDDEVHERWVDLSVDQRWHFRNVV